MKSILNVIIFTVCLSGLMDCTDEGVTEPGQTVESDPKLELVRLDGGFGKYSQSSSSEIEFGEIAATKSIYYLLLNRGNRDALDINFSSNDVLVTPSHIDLLPGESTESIESFPIIELTAVHVLPATGVGELLPFELGSIQDSVRIDYKFRSLSGDTNTIYENYIVSGEKLGCQVGLVLDNQDILELLTGISSGGDDPIEGYPWLGFEIEGWSGGSLNEVLFVNKGNVPLEISIYEENAIWGGDQLIEYSILPNDTIDIFTSGRRLDENVVWMSEYLRIKAGEYMLSFADRVYPGGAIALTFAIR